MSRNPSRIAAGITVYQPDMALLAPLLETVSASVGQLYLFIDGPIGEAIETDDNAFLRADSGRRILQPDRNLGIAAGLNAICEAAGRDGFERIVLFDQDSELSAGLIGHLDATLSRLLAEGRRPVAVGPRPVEAPSSDTKAPRYRKRGGVSREAAPVDFVIVSGCILDLAAWRRVGAFDETLRMDGVDVEWGFRAWSRGRSVWVDEGAVLPHRIGTGKLHIGPVAFPRQSLRRMRTYVHAQAQLLRLPHITMRWKLRSMIYVPVQIAAFALSSPPRFATARELVRAGRDGWATRGRR